VESNLLNVSPAPNHNATGPHHCLNISHQAAVLYNLRSDTTDWHKLTVSRHWKWYHSIHWIWFPISVLINLSLRRTIFEIFVFKNDVTLKTGLTVPRQFPCPTTRVSDCRFTVAGPRAWNS